MDLLSAQSVPSRLEAHNLNVHVLEAFLFIRNTPKPDGASPAFRMLHRIHHDPNPRLEKKIDFDRADKHRHNTSIRKHEHHDRHTHLLSVLIQGTRVLIQHQKSKEWQSGGIILKRNPRGHEGDCQLIGVLEAFSGVQFKTLGRYPKLKEGNEIELIPTWFWRSHQMLAIP
eukprot:TCALIF_14148-PA protein Name:"Protein of unknown function" AED:0.46 eAED:0.46 QI:0/-1/0/1/-1/1/1/0/170